MNEHMPTIQDIDVDQAHLVTTEIMTNTARKFGTYRCFELEDGKHTEAIASPLSFEI